MWSHLIFSCSPKLISSKSCFVSPLLSLFVFKHHDGQPDRWLGTVSFIDTLRHMLLRHFRLIYMWWKRLLLWGIRVWQRRVFTRPNSSSPICLVLETVLNLRAVSSRWWTYLSYLSLSLTWPLTPSASLPAIRHNVANIHQLHYNVLRIPSHWKRSQVLSTMDTSCI